jgi:murein DD-endopeptidase MepM/ murein hydrolase activator NlpD
MSSHLNFFKHYHDFHTQSAFLNPLSPDQINALFRKYQKDLVAPIIFPAPYFVHDFTKPEESLKSQQNAKIDLSLQPLSTFPYSIGKYDEDRSGLYTQDIFQSKSKESARTIHVGIDFGMPPNSPVYAMMDGQIIAQGALPSDGDYGHVIITAHKIENFQFYILHGHLSAQSIERFQVGDLIKKGDILAEVGNQKENGGWFPHLHLQFSYLKPKGIDLPGVVSAEDRQIALSIYFNPLSLFYDF